MSCKSLIKMWRSVHTRRLSCVILLELMSLLQARLCSHEPVKAVLYTVLLANKLTGWWSVIHLILCRDLSCGSIGVSSAKLSCCLICKMDRWLGCQGGFTYYGYHQHNGAYLCHCLLENIKLSKTFLILNHTGKHFSQQMQQNAYDNNTAAQYLSFEVTWQWQLWPPYWISSLT